MRLSDTSDLIPTLEKRTKRFSNRQNSEGNLFFAKWVASSRADCVGAIHWCRLV